MGHEMGHGGARRGAGKPKGHKHSKTLAKEAAREVFREEITKELLPIAQALVSRAKGVRYFVTRNKKTGKYEIVTNPEQVVSALNSEDDNSGEFYTALPDVQAIRESLDRALDKAKEQEQNINLNIDWALTQAIQAGRKRAADAKA